jgi:RNA polymerase sigma factor (TIGR02999 family)
VPVRPPSDTLGSMSDVTRLLEAAAAGDRQAAADLLPLVYDELRKLAAAKMAAEAPGHTLNATGLVHEAYLQLVGDQRFDGRGHFFAAAAEAMRRILVDSARRKRRIKRGGDLQRVELDSEISAAPERDERLIALDEALDRFAAVEPQKTELLKLRAFGGLTLNEAANVLEIAPSTADRWWAYARAWLRVELSGEKSD